MEPKNAARPARQSTLKGIFIGAGVGLIIAVLAYLVGGQVGRSAARDGLAAAESQTQAARLEAAKAREVNELLRARGFLADAALSLERRNYGSASESLRRSNQMIQRVDAGAVDVDPARLGQIDEAIAALDLTVQADVGEQRNRVLDLATELGDLIPEPEAPAAEPAP